jgi:hypothetical protein
MILEVWRFLQLEVTIVAVDERGDVIQWGRAFSHTFVPELTLTGKNITNVKIRSFFQFLT